jgi:predicted metal-binding membrane protein
MGFSRPADDFRNVDDHDDRDDGSIGNSLVVDFCHNQPQSARAGSSVRFVWVFLAGYVASWTGFSFVATLAQWGLHNLELISPMMVGASPVLGSLVLTSAGIYQWTPFKYACLKHCRAPLQFLLSCWHDGNVGAFPMGMRHGAYCLGCCWLLMAVLFAVGVMNLAWITALSVFVLLEKVIPRGLLVARTAGVVLMGCGGWLAVSGGA